MKQPKLNRRELLKSAAIATGVFGVTSAFQNCAPVTMKDASNTAASSCAPDDSRTADPGVNQIAGNPVLPGPVGTADSINAVFTEVLHRSQLNTSASNSQKMLIVAIGADPANGVYAPIRFAAGTAFTGVSEILVYVPGVNEPVLRRIFSAGDLIPETMFLLDDAVVAAAPVVTVVTRNPSSGYFKVDVKLENPVAYSGLVKPWVANTPFGSSTFTRPYVAGAGLASGGQGDLGQLHMPRFDVTGNNIDVTLGVTTKHPRISENHYVAGCGIYDQNGHPIGPVYTIMYGSNYPDVSVTHFKDLRRADRGTTLVRSVVFDTYNGYLMGFHKL